MSDAADAGVPWGSSTVRVVLASAAVLPLGVPLLSPVLPAIRDAFGLTDAGASLVITAYFLPGVVLSPAVGAVADRFGRRGVLLGSLAAFGVTGAAVATGPPFAAVLGLRLVQGTAAAGVFIVTVTLVGDAFDGVRRNAVLGVNVAVLFAAAAVYPLVGGALVARGWTVPFLAYLLALPVLAYAVVTLREPARTRASGGLAYLRGAADALPTRPALGLYGATVAIEAVAFGTILTGLPFLLERSYGVAPIVIGAVVTANTLAGAATAAANGRFARRLRNRRLVATGFVVVGVGLVGAWLADGPAAFGVAAAVFGVGSGLVLPSVDAAITTIAPSAYRAGALSLRNSLTFLGRAAGPVVFAVAAGAVGYRALFAATGVVLVIAGLAGVSATGGPRLDRVAGD